MINDSLDSDLISETKQRIYLLEYDMPRISNPKIREIKTLELESLKKELHALNHSEERG